MKSTLAHILLVFLLFGGIQAQAQTGKWVIGLGGHAVDYNSADTLFDEFFNTDNWNAEFPNGAIWVSRKLNPSLSLEGMLSGLRTRKSADQALSDFWEWDLKAKLHMANGKILKEDSWLDPFLFVGGGVTRWDDIDFGMMEVGVGTNIWLARQFGLRAQTGLNFLPTNDNYFHHMAGIVFRTGKSADADGDGIADSKDECPNVAGLAAFKGCPDRDGDGITDKLDECPGQKGTAAFKGCPDTDGDGIRDKDDKCPRVAGIAKFNGCVDTDGDGIVDSEDGCPKVKGPAMFKGCPDTDRDGVADSKDDCPKVPGVKALNGCPDSDGDGIADGNDKCPSVKGVASENGCPPALKVNPNIKVEVEKKLNFSARAIEFETGSAVIRKSSYTDLNNMVTIMRSNPSYSFAIGGHTDNVGSESGNKSLSQRRANAVMKYITEQGIGGSRLSATGYGEANPIADNNTAEGRQRNRRVEVTIR